MSFPRYPKYKDSGVEWLGDVPEHWEIDRIKWSTACCRNGIWGGEAQQADGDIPCVRVADFDRESLRVELDEPTIRNVPEKDRVGRQLRQGDLLLEKSGGGENQPVGCVVLYDDPTPAVCSNFVARVAVAEDMNSSFWRYVHSAAYAVRLNTKSIKQTSGIQNLDSSQYFDERSVFPPTSEQTAIAAFLDRETAKIDGLVAEQRRLMELLKEKRQAVISHAVTKGLNPDAPMKPSGIEWLGDVPEHWEVRGVRYLTEILRGKFTHRPRSDPKMYGGPYPFIQTGEISPQSRYVGEYHQTLSEVGFGVSKQFPKGTLVMTITGAGTANVAILNYVACFPDSIVGFVPKKGVSIDYLYNLFIAMREVLLSTSVTNTQPNLNIERIGALLAVNPPAEEQDAIVKRIDKVSGAYAEMTAEAQRAIDLLQERRTALISAAVTGQIDVRQLAEKEAA